MDVYEVLRIMCFDVKNWSINLSNVLWKGKEFW